MGKKGQKSSGLLLAGLLLVTCCDGHTKDWLALAKKLHYIKILIKIFVPACSNVHLIMVNDAQYCNWNLKSSLLKIGGQISFSIIILWSFFKPANKLILPDLDHLQKLRKGEIKASLHEVA